ncbi:hypothetical protein P3T31_004630 [Rhizobium sp. AN70]|nr:hypothetical protein [Rhizobium sp. AN70]
MRGSKGIIRLLIHLPHEATRMRQVEQLILSSGNRSLRCGPPSIFGKRNRTIKAHLEDIALQKRAERRGEIVKRTTAASGVCSASWPL